MGACSVGRLLNIRPGLPFPVFRKRGVFRPFSRCSLPPSRRKEDEAKAGRRPRVDSPLARL